MPQIKWKPAPLIARRRIVEDENLTEQDRVMRRAGQLAAMERAVFSPVKQKYVKMKINNTGSGVGFTNSEEGRLICMDREITSPGEQINIGVVFEGCIAGSLPLNVLSNDQVSSGGKTTNMLQIAELSQIQGTSL